MIMLIVSIGIIFGLAVGSYVVDIRQVDEKLESGWANEYESDEFSELLYLVEQAVPNCPPSPPPPLPSPDRF